MTLMTIWVQNETSFGVIENNLGQKKAPLTFANGA